MMLPKIFERKTFCGTKIQYIGRSETVASVLPCFPENETGLILIFTPKYGTRAYFRVMYYFDISKNEVTK